jgi:DNA-binding GntR family transcriptional regulator
VEDRKHLTKREYAVHAMRNAIQTGRYQPGEVVSQRRLMEDLDLGVTPVREAIIQLAAMGLVQRHSHHSIKVTDVDAERLKNMYHVRHLLELDAVRQALPKISRGLISDLKKINATLKSLTKSDDLNRIDTLDRQFHSLVFEACGNEALTSAIEFVKSSFALYAFWSDPRRLSTSVAEHRQFIERLEERDLKGCLKAHEQHLKSGLEAALSAPLLASK